MVLYPEQVVFVAYASGTIKNIYIRGNNVRELVEKILTEFENATGGGNRDDIGERIKTKDLERFKKEVLERL